MIRPSRTVLGLLGWVVAAAAAVTAGIFAVGAIGSGISGSTTSPLSHQAVAKALAQTTARSAEPPATRASRSPRTSEPGRTSTDPSTDPTSSRRSSGRSEPPARSGDTRAGNTRVLAVRGGSIVASCDNGLATLQSWSPRQGYEADGIHRGPESVARIEFTSDAAETKVEVACQGGIPVAHQELDDDH